jgi:hypothetical protein
MLKIFRNYCVEILFIGFLFLHWLNILLGHASYTGPGEMVNKTSLKKFRSKQVIVTVIVI